MVTWPSLLTLTTEAAWFTMVSFSLSSMMRVSQRVPSPYGKLRTLALDCDVAVSPCMLDGEHQVADLETQVAPRLMRVSLTAWWRCPRTACAEHDHEQR
jgi:hypothetical protein